MKHYFFVVMVNNNVNGRIGIWGGGTYEKNELIAGTTKEMGMGGGIALIYHQPILYCKVRENPPPPSPSFPIKTTFTVLGGTFSVQ